MESDRNESIRALYELYRHDIYKFARYMLGDSGSASDVVQEVYTRAIRRWGGFRREANAKTWLLSITRNYIYDELRRQRRTQEFVTNYAPLLLDKTTTSVEHSVLLEELLKQLKPTYRQVFILRHVEELSIEETVKVLGWTKGKVRMTDFRATARLRELWQEHVGEVNE